MIMKTTKSDLSSTEESPSTQLDRQVHATAARFSMGLSPIALGLAFTDWALHLASSPGRQLELAELAWQRTLELSGKLSDTVLEHADHLGHAVMTGDILASAAPKPPVNDKGRTETASAASVPEMPVVGAVLEKTTKDTWNAGMQAAQAWWHEATKVRGVSQHHQQMNDFMIRQMFAMTEPANWPASHPEVLEQAFKSGGQSILQGGKNFLDDLSEQAGFKRHNDVGQFQVGKNLAMTPGKVVYRNHLVELIQYTPQTAQVFHDPVLIVPSWIMKYYILDLQQHNSMVRYLVQQGHTVFILSWHNPDESDRELGMNDYLQQGIFDVLTAIAGITDKAPVHAVGYCLGGTLLSIAVAALARDAKVKGFAAMSPVKSMTLLAAQTDFSEPGEMSVLIDDAQVDLIEDLMADSGYMTGAQMAGSFQFLNSRDLVWNKRMNEYLLGVRDSGTDMMAWNADVTRLPARMHGEYLHQFFLENALAEERYLVEDVPVSLLDIRIPVLVVGTVRDTVSPWKSVYKIHRLTRTDVTFILTSGGHNAGIVSEPGHANRSYQILTQAATATVKSPPAWEKAATRLEGSWWTAWDQWLAKQSGDKVKPPRMPKGDAAPGSYVYRRFT
jgi:polyhydroxyalkanoate synthase